MTVRHVVMFEFQDGTTASELQELTGAAVEISTRIADVRAYHCGTDLGLARENYDFAAVADFDDEQAYERFRWDPPHLDFVDRFITKSLGYDLIEIPLLDPSTIDAGMTRRVLEEDDLGATCSLGLSFDTDISSADGEVASRGEELLMDAVSVTRDIGATYVGGVIHSAMGKYVQPASDAGRRNCVDVLRRVAEKAASSGITVGIESVNRYESNVVNTAEQALVLIDEIGADNVVVHLDTYHMNIEEGDLAAPVLNSRDKLGYVHIGESHRGYLGSGSINSPACSGHWLTLVTRAQSRLRVSRPRSSRRAFARRSALGARRSACGATCGRRRASRGARQGLHRRTDHCRGALGVGDREGGHEMNESTGGDDESLEISA